MQEKQDTVSGSGRSPGEGNGNPLQYSCLENPTDKRTLAGYSPWCCQESDTTEQVSMAQYMLVIKSSFFFFFKYWSWFTKGPRNLFSYITITSNYSEWKEHLLQVNTNSNMIGHILTLTKTITMNLYYYHKCYNKEWIGLASLQNTY